jgi:hypothetical protein
MKKIETLLNKLTEEEKVNLAFQLMDYISDEMVVKGNTITIRTNKL